jgi:hypothetical protein
MDMQEYIQQSEAATIRVNKFLKTITLGDGSKVLLPKTPNDPHPLPRKDYYKERNAFINDFLAKEYNR